MRFDEQPDCDSRPVIGVAKLDTCVTVLDATTVMSVFTSLQTLKDDDVAWCGENEPKSAVDLLVEHIEFADVLLLNKADQVAGEDKQRMLALLRRLNPDANICVTSFSKVDLSKVCCC